MTMTMMLPRWGVCHRSPPTSTPRPLTRPKTQLQVMMILILTENGVNTLTMMIIQHSLLGGIMSSLGSYTMFQTDLGVHQVEAAGTESHPPLIQGNHR